MRNEVSGMRLKVVFSYALIASYLTVVLIVQTVAGQ